jgi:hypothetical protein
MSHPKTDEHVNPSVEVHHLVGKLSMAETLLTEIKRKVPSPGKQLFVIKERLYAHPVLYSVTNLYDVKLRFVKIVGILRLRYKSQQIEYL